MTFRLKLLELSLRAVTRYMKNEVTGVEKIPKTGGFIAASNHLSLLDGLFLPQVLVTARQQPVHFLSYSELFDIRFLGLILRTAEGIVLNRSTRAGIERSLADCRKCLEKGEGIGMFPEAHLGKPEKMRRARHGTALLALQTGCPVVPCGLIGTDRTMPRGTTEFHFVRRAVTIRIGEAMDFGPWRAAFERAGEDERAVLLERVSTAVMRKIAALSGQHYPYGAESYEKLARFRNGGRASAV